MKEFYAWPAKEGIFWGKTIEAESFEAAIKEAQKLYPGESISIRSTDLVPVRIEGRP